MFSARPGPGATAAAAAAWPVGSGGRHPGAAAATTVPVVSQSREFKALLLSVVTVGGQAASDLLRHAASGIMASESTVTQARSQSHELVTVCRRILSDGDSVVESFGSQVLEM